MKYILWGIVIVLLTAGGIMVYRYMHPPVSEQSTDIAALSGDVHADDYTVALVVENLEIPRSIVRTDADRMLVTERPGRVREIIDGVLNPDNLYEVTVSHESEEGMLGMVLDPDYTMNKYVYLAYSYKQGNEIQGKVVRLRDDGDRLSNEVVIIDHLPAAENHAGTDLGFGPDGKLYISVGDSLEAEKAQYPDFYQGKILRINKDGSIPVDNPFEGYATRSVGHRNIQGFDWDRAGVMYASEHGPSVFDGPPGGDEVNMIEKGHNYGWPVVSHEKTAEGMIQPIALFTPAIAPASLLVYKADMFPQWEGNIFVGMLRGEGILRLEVNAGHILHIEKIVDDQYGRIRFVGQAPDGSIYFTTSNEDDRGTRRAGGDQIYRISKG